MHRDGGAGGGVNMNRVSCSAVHESHTAALRCLADDLLT